MGEPVTKRNSHNSLEAVRKLKHGLNEPENVKLKIEGLWEEFSSSKGSTSSAVNRLKLKRKQSTIQPNVKVEK